MKAENHKNNKHKEKFSECGKHLNDSYLRAIFDKSPFPILVLNLDSEAIIYCSHRVGEVFGKIPKTRSELYHLIYPDSQYPSEVKTSWKSFLKTAQRSNIALNIGEYDIHCKNGDIKICEIYIQYLPGKLVTTFHDISEKKKNEQLIINTKEKYRKLVESLPNIVFTITIDGVITYINTRGANYLNFDQKTLIGKNIYTLINKKAIKELSKKMELFLLKNKQTAKTEVIIELNGRNSIIEIIATRINYDNVVKEILVQATDVTKRRQAERAVKENEKIFRTIFENAPVSINSFDSNGKCLLWNKECERILGFTKEDLNRSDDPFALFYPDALIREEVIRTVISEPDRIFREWSPVAKNGKKMTMLWANFRISEEKVISIGHDITKQKQAQKKLKENEEMLRNIYENSSSVFYSYGTNETLNYVSPRIKDVLGYTQEEAKGNWMKLLSDNPINKNGYQDILKSIETGKRQETYEFELVHKNGTKVLVEARQAPVIKNGKLISIVGSFNDITLRKQNEQELLIAKEKAEESDKLKSAFLSNISHEIRTPMNGIFGFTSLLENADLSNEARGKYIQIIKKSGDRMLETVNDLINISKIETGQEKLNCREINPCLLVEEVFEFFKPLAESKGLKFSFNHHCVNQCDLILLDANKLTSIVNNLIRNAIKYTDTGSIIIKSNKNDEYLTISVKDTGRGIPKNRHNVIFDRFVQADIQDEEALQGSGLGLSIVKAYTDMMEGNISFESRVGEGSCFTVKIPIKNIKKETIKPPKDVNANLDIKFNKILIAEDDEISYRYLAIGLEPYTIQILHAANGEEAVQTAKDNPDISLILMDIKMPVMDGLEATKKIRQFNKTVTIVSQTAYAMSEDKTKSLEAGCNAYISKPIDINRLLTMLDQLR